MSKIGLSIILALLLISNANGQKLSKLGRAELVWVFCHPFSVIKAKKLTEKAIIQTDSIQKIFQFPNPKSGGKKDALRHTYWMALLTAHIGEKRAIWLGNAHEKKGFKDFKKGRLENGAVPDLAIKKMDDYNNQFGVKIGSLCVPCDDRMLLNVALESLLSGELRILKQNNQGEFLDAAGKPIPIKNWKGKWKNERVLVPSNY